MAIGIGNRLGWTNE
jgi:hypothetical protein